MSEMALVTSLSFKNTLVIHFEFLRHTRKFQIQFLRTGYNCIGPLTSLPLTLVALADTYMYTHTHFLIGEAGYTCLRSSDSQSTGVIFVCVCVCACTL